MNKTVVITGGTRGIGEACVRLFSKNMNVAFFYLNSDERAISLERETSAVGYKVDVSDRESVRNAIKQVYERFGSIDVLVNNAGVDMYGTFQDVSEDEIKRLYDVNLFGALNCAREVVPYMVNQKSGAIVNVSSVWGRLGGSYEVDYSTSKGALITFTKALAKELGPSGVRVNSVSPGMIDTDMNASLSDEEKRAFLDNTALGRIGNPNEVAKVIEFLANNDSSYVTGVDIAVDGMIL